MLPPAYEAGALPVSHIEDLFGERILELTDIKLEKEVLDKESQSYA